MKRKAERRADEQYKAPLTQDTLAVMVASVSVSMELSAEREQKDGSHKARPSHSGSAATSSRARRDGPLPLDRRTAQSLTGTCARVLPQAIRCTAYKVSTMVRNYEPIKTGKAP